MNSVASRNAVSSSARGVLIVGATGFLGSALARRFVERGDRVVGIGRGDGSGARLADVRPQIDWYDIERDGFEAPFENSGRIDLVIYTAASFGRAGESPERMLQVNTALPLRMLSAAVVARCGLFLYADTALNNVVNAYSVSKRQFAEWGQFLAAESAIRFVDLRLEHMYGPGDDEQKFPAFVIATLLRNEPVIHLTAGEQRRDFVYIDDVVSACEVLAAGGDRLPAGYQEYSIGSGRSVTIRDFVELVRDLTQSTTRLEFGALPYRPREVMVSEAQLDDMKAFGWRPRTKLEDGVRQTIEAERERCAS